MASFCRDDIIYAYTSRDHRFNLILSTLVDILQILVVNLMVGALPDICIERKCMYYVQEKLSLHYLF